MKNIEVEVKDVAFRTFVSVFFCATFAYIFFSEAIFNHRHSAFLSIAIGTIGSLFFYALRFGLRNALTVLLCVSLIFTFLIMRSWGLYTLRNFLVIITSVSVIYLYFKVFYSQSKWQKLLEPLILAMLFAVGNLFIFTVMVLIVSGKVVFSFRWVFEVMEQFFLIGLGVGIGVIITEEPYSKIIRARIHAFLG
jgi:hypothetical protein